VIAVLGPLADVHHISLNSDAGSGVTSISGPSAGGRDRQVLSPIILAQET